MAFVFSYKKSCLVTAAALVQAKKLLDKERATLTHATKHSYDDAYASINLPNDAAMHDAVLAAAKQKRQYAPAYLIVVGIGGSDLGTIAVQEAVLGKYYDLLAADNESSVKRRQRGPKIIYADTVDADAMHATCTIMEQALRKGDEVIINAVSKSGNTTETIANFQVLLNVVRAHRKNAADYVVVTTDKGSPFWQSASHEGFSLLEIPKNVGGRYSLFSPVGLFPLAMLGIDTRQLLAGAAHMKEQCLSAFEQNPAMLSAAVLYHHYRHKRNIADMFLFSSDLESVGKWYRQLLGESIGKEFDKNGKRVHVGITPTVSIGSTDLHSMAQLFLGGPQDKVFTLVTIDKVASLKVPRMNEYAHLVKGIQGKELSQIMCAISQGVEAAFIKGKRPYMHISLPDKSAYCIGQLLQMYMLQVIYLAALLNVNPFDQPNVESYKKETRRLLGK